MRRNTVQYLAETLRSEFLLLQLEDEGVELLLQSFVGVIDQQLLQRIRAERFESEDVQQPDKSAAGNASEGNRTAIVVTSKQTF